jgi:hypothetical protein
MSLLSIQQRSGPTEDDLPGCLRTFGRKAWTLASGARLVEGVTLAGDWAHRKVQPGPRRFSNTEIVIVTGDGSRQSSPALRTELDRPA